MHFRDVFKKLVFFHLKPKKNDFFVSLKIFLVELQNNNAFSRCFQKTKGKSLLKREYLKCFTLKNTIWRLQNLIFRPPPAVKSPIFFGLPEATDRKSESKKPKNFPPPAAGTKLLLETILFKKASEFGTSRGGRTADID